MSEFAILYGPWRDPDGREYRAIRFLETEATTLQVLHGLLWLSALSAGGAGAAALELQRLAGERDAAMREGKRSGLLAAAVLAEHYASLEAERDLTFEQLAAELEALAKGGASDG